MSFRNRLVLIFWVTACLVASPAQDRNSSSQNRPDLTGIWERNPSKSKSNLGPLPGVASLTISHKEPELRVTRKSNSKGQDSINESTFYADGRGEKNIPHFQTAISIGPPNPGDAKTAKKSGEVTSKTKWEGKKLVSRSSMAYLVAGHRLDVDLTEKRELSSDGKTLTIVTSVNGSTVMTEVFDRVQ